MKKLSDYLYYEEENPSIKIYCGDCLEIMPLLPKVDLVVTDPPYEEEAHTKQRRTRALVEFRVEECSIPFDCITEEQRTKIIEWSRLNCNGWAMFFCQAEAVGKYQTLIGDAWRRSMIWIKPDGMPQYSGDRPGMGYESIALAWFGKGKSIWNGGGSHGVYTYNKGDNGGKPNPHPTMKPRPLMKRLLVNFSNQDQLILDPFLGSGTTAVVAKELKRNLIGIEINEKYCEIAKKRLQNTQRMML